MEYISSFLRYIWEEHSAKKQAVTLEDLRLQTKVAEMKTILKNLFSLCTFCVVGKLILVPESEFNFVWALVMGGYTVMVFWILKLVEVASNRSITLISYILINSGYGIHLIASYY